MAFKLGLGKWVRFRYMERKENLSGRKRSPSYGDGTILNTGDTVENITVTDICFPEAYVPRRKQKINITSR